MMSTGELLSIDPQELQFPFELRKQISCSLNLSNKTDNYVAFKVKTTNPKKYCVRPNTGVVFPRSTCNLWNQLQCKLKRKHLPICSAKDKFLLESVVASPGATPKDIFQRWYSSYPTGSDFKFGFCFLTPPRPPSPVREGSSPTASVSENGSFNAAELSSTKSLVSKLTEEKNSVVQKNNKLQQELELLRRDAKKGHGGIPFVYIILVGLVGVILGYLLTTYPQGEYAWVGSTLHAFDQLDGGNRDLSV
ncbi:hypothetical protein GQ457_02G000210 [Hibiscus cannabinus]